MRKIFIKIEFHRVNENLKCLFYYLFWAENNHTNTILIIHLNLVIVKILYI